MSSVDVAHDNRAKPNICTIRADLLRGLLLAAGNDDQREYLNGIHFEPQANTLSAGNGSILLIAKQNFNTNCKAFIIPRKACEQVITMTTDQLDQIVITVHDCGLDGVRTFKLNGPMGFITAKDIGDRKVGVEDLARSGPPALSFMGSLTEFDSLRTGIRLIAGKPDLELKIQINDPFPALVSCKDASVLGALTPWTAEQGLSAWRHDVVRRLLQVDAADCSESEATPQSNVDRDKSDC